MAKFELEPYNRNISEDELLADLRKIASENQSISLTREAYELSSGRYSSGTLEKRFGSWNKALERAGLTANVRRDIPNEELFANLESVWTRLGRQPRYDELRAPLSQFSVMPYQRRFGTFRKALESFVASVNDDEVVSDLTDELVIERASVETKIIRSSRYIGWRTRFLVMQRDSFKCRHCGRGSPTVQLHVDHVKAWSKGGPSTMDNLQTLCHECNIGKGDLDLD
jgi:hypothetical protein